MFLTTRYFADSHRIAAGLHATGCVSLCLKYSLIKYFLSTLFCNHKYSSIVVYLLITTDTQSKLNVVLKVSNSVFRSHLLKSEPEE